MADHTKEKNEAYVIGYWDADGLLSIRNGRGEPLSRELLVNLGLGDDSERAELDSEYLRGFNSRLEEFDQEAAVPEDTADPGDVVDVATWAAAIARLKPGAQISLVMGNDPPGNLSVNIDSVLADTERNELEIIVSIVDDDEEDEEDEEGEEGEADAGSA